MKNLFLICDNYPFTNGEFFIDDEIAIIGKHFKKIVVLNLSNVSTNHVQRIIPSNLIVYSLDKHLSFWDKIKTFRIISKKFFWDECFFVFSKKNIKNKSYWLIFKIMFNDYVRAIRVKKKILSVLFHENIKLNEIIFYSYWHDFKALALSLLKLKNPNVICIARAHGWDVFSERHTPSYLPFKAFIITQLNKTYSISTAGKMALLDWVGNRFDEKIEVSRLGKINHRMPNMDVSVSYPIIICTCSNIIPVKRLHYVVDLISLLPFNHIKWIHFGDGTLRNTLEKYAYEKLFNKAEYEIKGVVSNSEILDFYNQNYVELFINLSESEGIPVSIMEALSAGIPVLATNVGGVSEIVKNSHGFLIPKDFNMHDVVEVVKNYILSDTDTKMQYRLNAYNFWKNNYDANKNYLLFLKKIFNL